MPGILGEGLIEFIKIHGLTVLHKLLIRRGDFKNHQALVLKIMAPGHMAQIFNIADFC